MSAFSEEIAGLKGEGVVFEAGLTNAELEMVHAKFGVSMPMDLRSFLQSALPVSQGFPNWRSALLNDDGGDARFVFDRLAWPLEGMLFDVENNGFWLDEWGLRPSSLTAAFELVRQRFKDYPKLVPIFSHRYIPTEPCEVGNPIFSIHQTDIILYGVDLVDYLNNEFLSTDRGVSVDYAQARRIRFWSEMAG